MGRKGRRDEFRLSGAINTYEAELQRVKRERLPMKKLNLLAKIKKIKDEKRGGAKTNEKI